MERFIVSTIKSSCCSNEQTELKTVIDTVKGEAFIEVSKKITERLPVTEMSEAELLFDKITAGNGRRVYSLKDLG